MTIKDLIASLQNREEAAFASVSNIFASSTTSIEEKMEIAEVLGKVGDHRLVSPNAEDYWVHVDLGYTKLLVAKFPVTTQEWRTFLEGDYNDDSLWSIDGLKWKSKERPSCIQLASSPAVANFVIENQPAVGISWFEAEAFAKAYGARLPDCQERIDIVRGQERRVYPWGKSFGHGNCNTEEVGLGRPCVVGLFPSDKTPEGVYDLAGNVAEWTNESFEGKARLHPGSWSRGMMSSWSKAFESISPAARLNDLGFRLVKDL